MTRQRLSRYICSLILVIFILNLSSSCFLSKKYQIIPTNPNPGNPKLNNLAEKFDTEKDLIIVPDKSFRLAYCVQSNEIYECGNQSEAVTFDNFFMDLDELLKGTDISANLVGFRPALIRFYAAVKNGYINFYRTSTRTKAETKEFLEEMKIIWKFTINIWDARRNELPKDSWSSEPRLFALVSDNFIFLLHGPKRTDNLEDAVKRLEVFLTNPRPQGDIN